MVGVAFENYVGQRFGRLTIIAEAGRDKKHNRYMHCHCDCGERKTARFYHLQSGDIQSCGCYCREAMSVRRRTHGHSVHGRETPEYKTYKTWEVMRSRCKHSSRQNYNDYGGRGIRVCERWNTYENFLADMGLKPVPEYSIDRIDVNGNYEPGNCRWATWSQQANNRRRKTA